MKAHLAAGLLAAGLMVEISAPACAQNYPAKSIRIVTSPAGGGNDFPARLIARALSGPLGQQIVVDNRATILIADIVRQAPPDGYTLLVTGSAHWIGPLISKVTYDPVRDFAPITLIDRAPSVLVVHPSMPLKSVKELIALAKARPGEMNFSVGGPGSSGYLGALLFNHMAGVNIVSVPYKGTAPAMIDMLAGQVATMAATVLTGMPHIRSGRLRPLGITSLARSSVAPEIPTVSEAGLPGYESVQWYGMLAPAKTPREIVNRLHAEVTGVLKLPEIKSRLAADGADTVGSSPDEFTRYIQSELVKWARVARDAGIQQE